MHIPCPGCGTLTPFEGTTTGSSSTAVDCPGCGGHFRVALQAPETKGDPQSYLRAREYARANGIDVATAYSVLEGLISLEEAKGEVGDPSSGGSASERFKERASRRLPGSKFDRFSGSTPEPSSSGVPVRLLGGASERSSNKARPGDEAVPKEGAFDPGFAEAVKDGCLSPQQAHARGDRRALANRLSTRHHLPMDLAYMAADNRLTVHQAMLQKIAREGKSQAAEGRSASNGLWKVIVYVIVAAGLVAAGIRINSMWQHSTTVAAVPAPAPAEISTQKASVEEPPPVTPVAPPAYTVPKVDTTGQLIEIVGPDPKSVLAVFCGSGIDAGRIEPVEIVDTTPPSSGSRLGVFRTVSQVDGPFRAIRIRRDVRKSRWIAGDGRFPIPTEVVTLETAGHPAKAPGVEAAGQPGVETKGLPGAEPGGHQGAEAEADHVPHAREVKDPAR